jgi:hypothetical protein
MRLAFVTSLLPTGLRDTGFEIANAGIIRAFEQAGAAVTLFGMLRPGETVSSDHDAVVLAHMVIENAVADRGRKLGWLAQSLRGGLPVIATKIASLQPDLIRAIDARGPFDACIVSSAPVAAAYPALFDKLPCILVAHNVEHASARDNAATATGMERWLYRREARLLEREENAALAKSRFVLTLAEEDLSSFGPDLEDKSAVFPLVIEGAPTAAGAPASVEPTFDVGMIGTWTWQPNLIGLRWFMDEVAPRLPADLSIGIAGRHSGTVTGNRPNVRLLGRVADAAAFVESCRVIALASRSGTGVQLKTIETFQLGKPSVATRSSVRGIADLPTNCLVADDAERFAAALVKLVADVRSDRTSVADGRLFVSRQREGMAQAVRKALAAIA